MRLAAWQIPFGNTLMRAMNNRSLTADDDGGYFRARARTYYRAGALRLP